MADDEPIRNKPPCGPDDALAVLRRLRQAGHIAYFAGGCVRDVLMGLTPKDYDIASDAPPKRIRELFSNTQSVGAAFGVVLVKHGRSVVEVATFRSDGKYLDGRHPSEIRFTTPQQDAQRRDFTINGLFLDPLDGDRVIDFVGGRDDLQQRLLRAIGPPAARFAEDHLRMLRAVRFAARFGLTIDQATADAIIVDAPLLKRISPERIGEELRLMLTPPTRTLAWRLLWDLRLVEIIFRFLPMPREAEFPFARNLFEAIAPGEPIPPGLALAAACLSIELNSKAASADIRDLLQHHQVLRMVHAMRKALKISNEESDQMQDTLEAIAPLLSDAAPSIAAKKRFMAKPTAPQSRHLLGAMKQAGLYTQQIAALETELAALQDQDCSPAPLISGDDLKAAALLPGPQFRLILDAVYDAQLEGTVSTREQAMNLALSISKSNV